MDIRGGRSTLCHYQELTVTERMIIRIGPEECLRGLKHFQTLHHLILDGSDDSSTVCLGADELNSYQQIEIRTVSQ